MIGHLACAEGKLRLLSEEEAWATVEAQMLTKEAQDEAMRKKINAVTVLDQNIVNTAPSRIITRRIAPPGIQKSVAQSVAERPTKKKNRPVHSEATAKFQGDLRPHEMISASVTVYEGSHSRIYWRCPDTETQLTLWINIPLLYLNSISRFESASAHYSYFGFSEVVSQTEEIKRSKEAQKHGYQYRSRWLEAPIALSRDKAEYVIEADSLEGIPDKLYEQMDSLLGHYLKHKEDLEIAHRNAEKIRRARIEYEAKNPTAPKPSITNFWPGTNSSYQSAE